VEGDVFRFTSILASLRGEVTVAGDEMTGQLSGRTGLPGVNPAVSRMFLRRGDSSVPRGQEMR